jgi:hypothetical protein
MATFTWELQGTSATTIAATDKVQFAAATFDSAIAVTEWNDSTHVKTNADANKSSGNTPRNNKFISQAGGTGGDSQIQINGGSTVDLDTLTTANAALKINFSDAESVATTDAVFYAYDGTTPATAPVNVSIVGAEVGDTNWTTIEGSGSALSLEDSSAATSHDFYIAVSASPDTAGLKTGALRIELTYS